LKKFILTTGDGLYSSFLNKDENVYIDNYNDNNSYHEYVQLEFSKEIKMIPLTKEKYQELVRKDFKYLDYQVMELPFLKDYPKDHWGNVSRYCVRENNILILTTFFFEDTFS
jgi:hypothetical protein